MSNKVQQAPGLDLEQIEQKNHGMEPAGNTEVAPKPEEKGGSKSGQKKKEKERKTVSFFQLFRYSEPADKFLIVIASILAAIHGMMIPSFSVVFGRVTDDFTPDKSAQERRDKATDTAFLAFGFAMITFCSAGGGITLWRYIGSRMLVNLKKLYYKKVLEQEMGWFDLNNPESLTTKYAEEMASFGKGTGNSIHIMIFAIFLTFSGLAIGFIYGWLYALSLLVTIPIMFIGGSGFVMFEEKKIQKAKDNYADAGAVSEQALGAVKTVKSLNGEEHEIANYWKTLLSAKKASERLGSLGAFFYGLFNFSFTVTYGIGFFVGSLFIRHAIHNMNFGRDYTAGDIVSIFFGVTTGVFGLNQLGPSLQQVTAARQAAYDVYQVIERENGIKLNEEGTKQVESLKGNIEFKNVTFSYPSRKKKIILRNLSFKIQAGQKVAFVGETGCGKSTTVQLVERYYDATSGEVLIDGVNIKDYNLTSLRKKMGYVGQEPKLFAMSIKRNLLLAKPDATDEELNEALKKANAYEFVMKLEKGINTYVGSGGSQLSGGQKQRIAIARTALQNPQILLFDESTSALDRKNEREIQATLDSFASNRTSITIAHRLSTIINSDIIFVLDKGQIVEQGTHQDLLNKQGAYANLVKAQLGDQFEKLDQAAQNQANFNVRHLYFFY